MNRVSDPEWRALEVRILAWNERIRSRERELHRLDERLRELEQQLGALKRRLAAGTGVMASMSEPGDD
jgi:predicted  nucleic acid-binding Zn-ribbon protein